MANKWIVEVGIGYSNSIDAYSVSYSFSSKQEADQFAQEERTRLAASAARYNPAVDFQGYMQSSVEVRG